VSSIIDYLDDVRRISLFSYFRFRHEDFGLKFDIP